MMYTNIDDVDMWLLNPANHASDLQIPSALTAAVSIHQIFVGIQKPNPRIVSISIFESLVANDD